MDTRDLATFATVARLGGMGRAARALNTVQSNVTHESTPPGASSWASLCSNARHSAPALTAAGERLMPYANRLDALLEEARPCRPRRRLAARSRWWSARWRPPRRCACRAGSLPTPRTIRMSIWCCAPAPPRSWWSACWRASSKAPSCAALSATPTSRPRRSSRKNSRCCSAPGRRSIAELLRQPDLRLIILRAGCSYRQRLEELLRAAWHCRPETAGVRNARGHPRLRSRPASASP